MGLYNQPGMVPNFNRLNPSPTVPHLIGLSGYAGSGKDTVASVIHRLYGHEHKAFAARIKRFAYDLNPYVRHDTRLQDLVDAVGWDKAKAYPEVRRVLQEVGTRARDYFGFDVWVDSVFRDFLHDSDWVISDVRFRNEAYVIKDLGGVVLRVMRPGVTAANDHISEHDMDGWDFDHFVINDGTFSDLEGEVQRVLGEFGG